MSLATLTRRFQRDFGHTVHTAAEVEFYLERGKSAEDKDFLAAILLRCAELGIPVYGMNAEDGPRQYEIALAPEEPEATVRSIAALKKAAKGANFHPKPNADRPGCGLHLHISLHDASGANLMMKAGEEESEIMLHAIAGLLAVIPEAMMYFAPKKHSYRRFEHPDQHTPTYLCWGGNNRTAAVRIPASTLHPDHRHIELRVPGMDADPEEALLATLAGIHHGLTHKLIPPEKLYGNAFDAQYELIPLPCSLKEAKKARKEGKILKEYF